ncbi:hypothetical protein [Streptomyces sp. CFMR 7]|uniref:hypothetical protein n=1 Tax=Streptomyces sp. CFMR 7 TaxID=1649184 RepID=UPI0006AD2AB1|nr:hypothetical protein [Streptomyces sp. CFMR 7]ALC25687.1 hypothetical protein ABE83_00205 [Streptomyces sp. CFMR 7]
MPLNSPGPHHFGHRSRAKRLPPLIAGTILTSLGTLMVTLNAGRPAPSDGELTAFVNGYIAPLAADLPYLLLTAGVVLLVYGLSYARR